jgi:hypothetical protein
MAEEITVNRRSSMQLRRGAIFVLAALGIASAKKDTDES